MNTNILVSKRESIFRPRPRTDGHLSLSHKHTPVSRSYKVPTRNGSDLNHARDGVSTGDRDPFSTMLVLGTFPGSIPLDAFFLLFHPYPFSSTAIPRNEMGRGWWKIAGHPEGSKGKEYVRSLRSSVRSDRSLLGSDDPCSRIHEIQDLLLRTKDGLRSRRIDVGVERCVDSGCFVGIVRIQRSSIRLRSSWMRFGMELHAVGTFDPLGSNRIQR